MEIRILLLACAAFHQAVAAPEDPVKAAGGLKFSLTLQKNGRVKSCGSDQFGQLGRTAAVPRYLPGAVLKRATDIAAGYEHAAAVALDENGTSCAYTWGRNGFGQLGKDGLISGARPAKVLIGVRSVAAGHSHTLFLKTNGTVWACGANDHGQLGSGNTILWDVPVQVPNLSHIIAIACGGDFSLFLHSSGTVYACGANDSGQLGLRHTGDVLVPTAISGLPPVYRITAGDFHSLFLTRDEPREAWGCGGNTFGQLGLGAVESITTVRKLLPAGGGGPVIDLSAGADFSLFIQERGGKKRLLGSGKNSSRQLGVETIQPLVKEITRLGIQAPRRVFAGRVNSYVISAKQADTGDPVIWAAGRNAQGQLGTGNSTAGTAPRMMLLKSSAAKRVK